MNKNLKIATLQSLLKRVQMRSAQPRAARMTAVAVPVALPEPVDSIVEAKPAVVVPATKSVAPPTRSLAVVHAVALASDDDFEEIDSEDELEVIGPASEVTHAQAATELDLDAIVAAQTAIASAQPAEPEAPASPSKPVDIDLDAVFLEAALLQEAAAAAQDTEPPASGRKVVSAPLTVVQPRSGQIEVDFLATPGEIATSDSVSRPSIAQLGKTVELEEMPEASSSHIELASLREVPASLHAASDMEASLPTPQSPGEYSPQLVAQDVVQGSWTPDPAPESPAPIPLALPVDRPLEPAVAFAQAPAITLALPVLDGFGDQPKLHVGDKPIAEPTFVSTPAAEPAVKPAHDELWIVTEAAPTVYQVVPTPITAGQLPSADVVRFVGAVAKFEPVSFVELLDASLALGK